MSTAYQEDISSSVLRRMKEGGFDFSRFHPIEFYAIFPDEERARRAAGHFHRGESLNAQVSVRDDGAWALELSKVMYATYDDIGDFEQGFEAVVEPLGGIIEGWGVKQEIRGRLA
ncbi:ribonuclease E inhibitor RraB [Pseudomonas baetica]|uniref:ribonuclease E inhibitor RraB n=1 Tax=Pseudomonas baetica TaxID=674054 RepID=UPI003EE9CDF5